MTACGLQKSFFLWNLKVLKEEIRLQDMMSSQ